MYNDRLPTFSERETEIRWQNQTETISIAIGLSTSMGDHWTSKPYNKNSSVSSVAMSHALRGLMVCSGFLDSSSCAACNTYGIRVVIGMP